MSAIVGVNEPMKAASNVSLLDSISNTVSELRAELERIRERSEFKSVPQISTPDALPALSKSKRRRLAKKRASEIQDDTSATDSVSSATATNTNSASSSTIAAITDSTSSTSTAPAEGVLTKTQKRRQARQASKKRTLMTEGTDIELNDADSGTSTEATVPSGGVLTKNQRRRQARLAAKKRLLMAEGKGTLLNNGDSTSSTVGGLISKSKHRRQVRLRNRTIRGITNSALASAHGLGSDVKNPRRYLGRERASSAESKLHRKRRMLIIGQTAESGSEDNPTSTEPAEVSKALSKSQRRRRRVKMAALNRTFLTEGADITTLVNSKDPMLQSFSLLEYARRKPPPKIYGTRVVHDECPLKAAPPTRALFVTRFQPLNTADDIERYIKGKVDLEYVKCTQIKTKRPDYSSFHVNVYKTDFEKVKNIWPPLAFATRFLGHLTLNRVMNPKCVAL